MTKILSSKDVRYPGTEWYSVGREPRVYEAHAPGDLLGVHAELMASNLLPGEELRYLLYSPIWDGTWAPFDMSAQPASHALAVTKGRFLLTRDLHRDDTDPTVFSIPFDRVLLAECGNAHLLGWFSLRCVLEDGPGRVSVLFRATGAELFSSAIRHYRQALPRQVSMVGCAQRRAAWHDLWKRMGRPDVREVRPLILDDEVLLAWLRAGASWRYRRELLGKRPQCHRPENLLLWTCRGAIHVIHEPDVHPKSPSFGLTVRTIPREAMRLAEVAGEGTLRLALGRDKVVMYVEVPFDKEYRDQAESLALGLQRPVPPCRGELGIRQAAGGPLPY